MPELPEVETTVRDINKNLIGRRILALWTDYKSTFYAGKDNIKNPKYLERFRAEVIGKKIVGARRRAKHVIVDLEGSISILIHMKMTGHFLYGKFSQVSHKHTNRNTMKWIAQGNTNDAALNDPFNRHVRLVFDLDNGKHVAFSDMRRFATLTLADTKATMRDEHPSLADLGPEPFDSRLTPTYLHTKLASKKRMPIKQALLDQQIVAGIGNIYGDEILWYAGIDPQRPAATLSKVELGKVIRHMRKVLAFSISLGGDSMSDFRNIHGERGGFQSHHKAYRQTGKPCMRRGCHGTIRRIIIGGRSAHFCNIHQH